MHSHFGRSSCGVSRQDFLEESVHLNPVLLLDGMIAQGEEVTGFPVFAKESELTPDFLFHALRTGNMDF